MNSKRRMMGITTGITAAVGALAVAGHLSAQQQEEEPKPLASREERRVSTGPVRGPTGGVWNRRPRPGRMGMAAGGRGCRTG